jgi:hypothetical protein
MDSMSPTAALDPYSGRLLPLEPGADDCGDHTRPLRQPNPARALECLQADTVRSWLDLQLANLPGVKVRPSAETADQIYGRIADCPSTPEFKPRALYEVFTIEVLATAREACDDPSIFAAYRDGSSMHLGATAAIALGSQSPPASTRRRSSSPGWSTSRKVPVTNTRIGLKRTKPAKPIHDLVLGNPWRAFKL